jgi:cytochrome c peroxidase
MKITLLLVWRMALSAATEYFPVIGGSAQQTLTIRVIALGTRDTFCTAAVGFRTLSGEPAAEMKVMSLRIGQSQHYSFKLSNLGLADGERAEIRPVVELGSSLSVCWPAVEVGQNGVTTGYLSGTTLRMRRPTDAKVSPFIDVNAGEAVRVVVYRIDGESAPTCQFLAGFRGKDGERISPEETWTLNPAEARQIEYAPQVRQRVLLNLRPVAEDQAAGCVAAAQIYDRRTGSTLKVVPIALPRASELPAVPPPDPEEDTQPVELPSAVRPAGQVVQIRSPLGLSPLAIPEDNPATHETIALGRRLFYDTILSADGTIACASCHDPAAGFSDPRRLSLGVNGLEGERHSMSVLNAAFSPEVFWEGRSKGLEAQATMPVLAFKEFAHSLEGVERRLQDNSIYRRLFEEAWGSGPITYEMVAKSIATFQRTLLSGNSPVDRYLFGGDRGAIDQSAIRGLSLFQGVAGCSQCHSVASGRSATFGNDKFFNTGVAAIDFSTLKDQGRWKVTSHEEDRGAFRPPSLRNVESTAPYMHNGSLTTLDSISFFYAGGGRNNLWLSSLFRSLPRPPGGIIPGQEVVDLSNLLRALTGEMPENAGPPDD